MENSTKKILIIDDEEDMVKIISARLEFEGFTVSVALSGKSGLEIAKREKPDIILLDLMMPEIDGFEVCKRLNSDEKLKSIPIIIISALNDKKTYQIIDSLSVSFFMLKPFEFNDLLLKINELLKQ